MSQTVNLIDAVRALTTADYYLAVAATELEKTDRPGWTTRADALMRDCIALREAIAKEVGR